MFECNHCGGCCEDKAIQISLTLGDVTRLCESQNKTPLELYRENIIGIFPFANEKGFFELDLGLKIPCSFRKEESKDEKKTKDDKEFKIREQRKDCKKNKSEEKELNNCCSNELNNHNDNLRKCSNYLNRPLNCRFFPYWIIADAPKEVFNDMKENHPCGVALSKNLITEEDKNIFREYVKYLSEIFFFEDEFTKKFLETQKLKELKEPISENSINENRKIILKIIKHLEKQDFSSIFINLEKEIQRINKDKIVLISSKDIKSLNDFS